MKIAISVGHGMKRVGNVVVLDPGAVYHNMRENDLCAEIADMVQALCVGIPGLELYKVPPGTLEEKVTKVNEASPDYAIEIHLNASESAGTRGCEALYFENSKAGKPLAERFSLFISAEIYTINRGAKPRKDLYFLSKTKCPAIITEAEFMSNADVANALSFGRMRQRIAMGHVEAIWQSLQTF